MFTFLIENLSFFIFIFLLILFSIYKRKNLDIQGKFPLFYILMYKGKYGISLMKKWANNYPKTFLYLSYYSFIIGIVGVVFAFIFSVFQLFYIVINKLEVGGALVLPIKTSSGSLGGVPILNPPFLEWLIAISVLIIVHEFAHGVISQRFKVKIKSSGVAILGIILPIIPAAFVEPSEKGLSKKSDREKISVFGAGSASNFLFGILFLLLYLPVSMVTSSMYDLDKFEFNEVFNESDLNKFNITSGEIIQIDEMKDKTSFLETIQKTSIGDNINLTIKSNNLTASYLIKTYASPNNINQSMIGIGKIEIQMKAKEEFAYIAQPLRKFTSILFWIWFLNIGIGIVNLLPLWITDGGLITSIVLKKYFNKELAMKIYNSISFITLILLLLTIWPKLLLLIFF